MSTVPWDPQSTLWEPPICHSEPIIHEFRKVLPWLYPLNMKILWVIHKRMNFLLLGKQPEKKRCHSEKTTDLTSVGREANISLAVSYVTLCLLACIILKYGPYLEKCLLHQFVFKQTHIHCRITVFFRCFRKVNIGMHSMHLNRDIQTVSIPCWWISFLQLWREFLWIGGDHKNFLKWKWSQSIPCSHSLRCFVARKELTEWYARWKLFDNSRNWYVPETILSYSTELILDFCKLQHLLRHLRKTCECRLQWFHSMFRNKNFILISLPHVTHIAYFLNSNIPVTLSCKTFSYSQFLRVYAFHFVSPNKFTTTRVLYSLHCSSLRGNEIFNTHDFQVIFSFTNIRF